MQDLNPLQQLLLTLRFYASGSFHITMGNFNGIHKTTTGRVIKRVTEALISLRATYIKFPDTQEERNEIQRKFYEISRFPKAIDCTHIRIQSPGKKLEYIHETIDLVIYYRWSKCRSIS